MEHPFIAITESQAVDQLFTDSRSEPVLLFKHDPNCPISAAAYREMARLSGPVPLIDVEHEKEISAAIADRASVRHESPQVMVLRDGRAVWSASLFDISAEAVQRSLQQYMA